MVGDHHHGVAAGIEGPPHRSHRGVNRSPHPLETLRAGERPAGAPCPLQRVGDQGRVEVHIHRGVVGHDQVRLLLGEDPFRHPVEIAVEPFPLFDEGVEVDALLEIEPPVGDLPIGLARPRADGRGQAVLEGLRVGGEAVGAAAVETKTARHAIDAEHLAPGAVAARPRVVGPLGLEAQLHPFHLAHVAPVDRIDQPHRHRVVARHAVGIGVHQCHQGLDPGGRCGPEVDRQPPHQRRQPVVGRHLAGGLSGVRFEVEDLGRRQRRPRPHRSEVAHPVGRRTIRPGPHQGRHPEAFPASGRPQRLDVTGGGEA